MPSFPENPSSAESHHVVVMGSCEDLDIVLLCSRPEACHSLASPSNGGHCRSRRSTERHFVTQISSMMIENMRTMPSPQTARGTSASRPDIQIDGGAAGFRDDLDSLNDRLDNLSPSRTSPSCFLLRRELNRWRSRARIGIGPAETEWCGRSRSVLAVAADQFRNQDHRLRLNYITFHSPP